MNKASKILIAGNTGLLGTALQGLLLKDGYLNVCGASTADVDLRDQGATQRYFASIKPEFVFMCAARVGGIVENSKYPVDFIRDNVLIQTSVFEAARLSGVKKIMFYGSSCMYPRICAQPMKEEYLMTGPVEPTSAPYAMAKLAGVEMAKAYSRQCGIEVTVVIPCGMFGPKDEFDPEKGHLLSALMTRFHRAVKENAASVTIWGTGSPIREFMHVDDAVDGSIFLMNKPGDATPINLSMGKGYTVKAFAEMVSSVVGFKGEIKYDTTKPDGAPEKVLDISRISSLGWKSKIDIIEGLRKTYDWFCKNEGNM